jgi:hypothetical protein
MIRVDFWTYNGEVYGVNLRFLRQQILRAREQRDAEHVQLAVRMPAPETPSVYIDAFIRVSDLYLFGIQNRHCAFYFKDNPGMKLIGNQRLLGFTGHYNDLGDYGGLTVTRGAIEAAITQLGQWRRDSEITNKQKDRSGQQQLTATARHLLILVLMVSEAARFFQIEQTITNALDGRPNTPLTPLAVQELTHQWGYLSKLNDFRRVAIMNIA